MDVKKHARKKKPGDEKSLEVEKMRNGGGYSDRFLRGDAKSGGGRP